MRTAGAVSCGAKRARLRDVTRGTYETRSLLRDELVTVRFESTPGHQKIENLARFLLFLREVNGGEVLSPLDEKAGEASSDHDAYLAKSALTDTSYTPQATATAGGRPLGESPVCLPPQAPRSTFLHL